MNCRSARYCIQLQLDGDLPESKRVRLASHLLECSDCRAIERQLTTIQVSLRQMAAPTLMHSEAAPVERSLEFKPARQRPSRRIVAAIAAVLVAGVGLWLITDRISTPTRLETIASQEPVEPIENSPKLQPTTVLVQQDAPHDAAASPQRTAATETPPSRPRVHVRVSSSSDDLVVPMPTKSPNVSIFWIYPTVKTAEAPAEPAAESSSSS